MQRLFNFLVLFFFAFPAAAFVDVPLTDVVQERRAQELFSQIRCMVCQSQTIADSNAQVAGDIRRSVREQIASGVSDEKIKTDLAQKYGDIVLMKPPFKAGTILLWLGPWLVLSVGAIAAYFYFRGAKQKTL